MPLPFSVPSHIENQDEAMKLAVEIECYGLETEGISGILVDGSYWLEGHEASTSFYLVPAQELEQVPYSTASFFADCLAYEHEVPVFAIPSSDSLTNEDIPWCLKRRRPSEGPANYLAERYLDKLTYGAEAAYGVSSGPSMHVPFRYDSFHFPNQEFSPYHGFEYVSVDWSSQYASVRDALHLYNASLRQVDPLSQYLCSYRVIENTAHGNGKAWIRQKVTSPETLDVQLDIWSFGKPEEIVPDELADYVRSEKLTNEAQLINIMEIMRAHALRALDGLRRKHEPEEIAWRLYNENRCGIAHGRKFKAHDMGDDFASILNDLKLIRFLARFAIEQSMLSQ